MSSIALMHAYVRRANFIIKTRVKATSTRIRGETACLIASTRIHCGVGLDTNITKNSLNLFPEIPNFFSKYLEFFSNISKKF